MEVSRRLQQPWVSSVAIFIVFVSVWGWFTAGSSGGVSAADAEYARLAGQSAPGQQAGAIPSPWIVALRGRDLITHAFDHDNPNNLGIAWHLAYSMGRVALGFTLALLVAVPLGFLLGLWPACHRALDPFIQILRPVSPLAWMPLALYTFRDSTVSTIFIIFICAVWPMLISTATGTASVRAEWLNVSRVFGLPRLEHVTRVVFPASVPMILSGMRISIGIAWFVIVAAEMVGAQSGIGYFIWNEWNNLQIASMIVAIVLVGGIGLALDILLKRIGESLSFRE
ncbi:MULTISPECIES: ABC transporter permease [unclassified Bradyrhizobium]|uniref:ABC transporter permease n=1 Tax=unclassified Bradyrhizobium TaxID=2631580 RepID=UPI000366B2EB|nr:MULTISPECIES: ABC transporter permease [unclassified Bradyrhizobium]MCK1440613.1 ABC transporter permease [Bradyrhizobium sp. 15]MCK1525244.1 ABC transporter permease [Bradyrhizobium sp. 17]MCK1533649.1 ABC transporter permease [Bradyrhizobium sp. 176]MCK1560409.1 ABC transporter permease [Bradyrhizobium sp. 171]MCK1568638.1 ABC transporter permease [Bradyrhizobium sp. 173]